MTLEYSVSTINTFVSACSRINAIVGASKRVFNAFITAPVIGMPKVASKDGGTLGAIIETVSPAPIPLFFRADARLRHLW